MVQGSCVTWRVGGVLGESTLEYSVILSTILPSTAQSLPNPRTAQTWLSAVGCKDVKVVGHREGPGKQSDPSEENKQEETSSEQ